MIKILKQKLKNLELESNYFIFFNLIKRVRRRPFLLGLDFIICYFYSLYISFQIFGLSFFPKVFFNSDLFRVIVDKKKGGKVLTSVPLPLIFESFQHGVDRTVICIQQQSQLVISNTFTIGNGCVISLSKHSKLTLCGKFENHPSGITCNGKIICINDIYIGAGTIISWNSYITDSNNHYVNDHLLVKPVHIGENVWVSEGVTIGPGVFIGDGTIVAAKSFVNGIYPCNSLIAGCPAIIKRENIKWKR